MTSLLDCLVASVLAAILNFFIVSRIRKSFPSDESTFLVRVFLFTLILRYCGAIWLNMYAGDSAFADAFWGDSSTYDFGGYVLALKWQGEVLASPQASAAISGFGFMYFVAGIYYFVGRNQFLVQLVNGAIGSIAVLVIYAIARKLFDAPSAKWSARFTAFFPQMIFWSCAMYKDPSILLCIATSMLCVLHLREKFTPKYLLLFVAACLYLMTLRFYVFYMVAFATVGTFLFAQQRGLLGGLLAQAALVLTLGGAMVLGVQRETIESQTAFFDLDRLQVSRQGQASLGKSAYGTDINVSSPEGVVAALPVGLVYLLFAPFPWAISGLRQVMTLPETLVWYGLMPALVRGALYTIRHRLRAALPILVFASILTVAYAVFQSNVGTAYRQRTQITMFFFILMGVGIERRRLGTAAAKASRPALHVARPPVRS